MTKSDYRYAEVASLDISGEVLPAHDAGGAERPNRAEDWAFLAEAVGERERIEYRDAYPARTTAEVAAYEARIREYAFMKNLRVASLTNAAWLFGNVMDKLAPSRLKWCAGHPQERSWQQGEEGFAWETCPEMFPARALAFPKFPATKDYLWEAEYLRAAFADLAANEAYVCSNWYYPPTQKSHVETNTGMSEDLSGFYADYGKSETMGDVAWWRTVPRAPTLTLPEGAGTPRLATIWHAVGANAGVNTHYLKVTSPSAITVAFMESMLPQMTGSDDAVSVSMTDYRLIVTINLHTKLT